MFNTKIKGWIESGGDSVLSVLALCVNSTCEANKCLPCITIFTKTYVDIKRRG